MNLELTEEQDMIIGMVRKFVREEILPLELDQKINLGRLSPE